jgi:hypothetical protein
MTAQELNNLFVLDSKTRKEIISNLSCKEVSEALEKYYIIESINDAYSTRVPQKSENPTHLLLELHFNANYCKITFHTKEEYEKTLKTIYFGK